MIGIGNSSNDHLHRGMTLVEVLILISLSAVLTGVVITGVAALFRYNRDIEKHNSTQISLQQMTRTLRADIHQASSMRWDRDAQLLQLELSDSRMLEYRKLSDRWVRVDNSHDEEPVTTSFGVDSLFRCECQVEQLQQGDIFRLSLMNQPPVLPEQQSKTQRTLHCDVVAVVGRDFLFAE